MPPPWRNLLKNLLYPWVQPDREERPAGPLDYDLMFHLDAEELAEGGIPEAYKKLLPVLRTYTADPIAQVELLEDTDQSQRVAAGGKVYTIWSPNSDRGEGWIRAPIALFDIVNRSLAETDVRFYAFYGGNDLSGMFLTDEQVKTARAALRRRSDWPYLLVDEPPHYGHPNAA
jgi:hypothetical protein